MHWKKLATNNFLHVVYAFSNKKRVKYKASKFAKTRKKQKIDFDLYVKFARENKLECSKRKEKVTVSDGRKANHETKKMGCRQNRISLYQKQVTDRSFRSKLQARSGGDSFQPAPNNKSLYSLAYSILYYEAFFPNLISSRLTMRT